MGKGKLLFVITIISALCVGALAITWLYTTSWLDYAVASYGVYENPIEGMSALLGQQEIDPRYIQAYGPSCAIICNPYVWFVHVAGSGKGGGAYFLQTKGGWVHMPESAFPDLIGLGMPLFGLTP